MQNCLIISRWILLEWKMFQTKVLKKIKTHILCSITFFLKSCRLWDNMERYGTARQATDDNITRLMRFACWVTKDTDTHAEYLIIIIAFHTATMVTRTLLNITLYLYVHLGSDRLRSSGSHIIVCWQLKFMLDLSLPPLCRWDLGSSGILRSVEW
jgi:hypothetical protein